MKKSTKLAIFSLAILFAGWVILLFLKNTTPILAEEKNLTNGSTSFILNEVEGLTTGGEEMKASKSFKDSSGEESFKLPEPKLSSKTSVEEALSKRRSVRDYEEDSLSIEEISQLLWSAQGITVKWGGRTAPSAGALYPLEIYVAVGEVKGLKPGLYHYDPEKHIITKKADGDLRQKLTEASLYQDEITKAPATFVITAVYERTMKKYKERGIQYVHMEVGAVAENIYLQAETLNLGTVFMGAFEDEKVKKVLGIKEEPLAIMPVGKKLSTD
jgi:SagB-type dehydrogenase family enzyme